MPPALLGPDLDAEPPQPRGAVRRMARGVVDGARHVWHHRRAGNALAAIAAHRFFYGVSTIPTLLLFPEYFPTRGDGRAGLRGAGAVFSPRGLRRCVAPRGPPPGSP